MIRIHKKSPRKSRGMNTYIDIVVSHVPFAGINQIRFKELVSYGYNLNQQNTGTPTMNLLFVFIITMPYRRLNFKMKLLQFIIRSTISPFLSSNWKLPCFVSSKSCVTRTIVAPFLWISCKIAII